MNMEEIRREAMDDYKRRTKEQKQVAWQFFQAIDKDGNGSISVHEFSAFLRENGLYKDDFFSVFVDLDKDGGGVLDFDEVWQTTAVREVTVDPGMIKEPLQVLKGLINVWNVGVTVVNEIGETVVNEIGEESVSRHVDRALVAMLGRRSKRKNCCVSAASPDVNYYFSNFF